MSLFGELQRRNVFRVATAYVVASWLLLQVADLILDNTGAPAWVIQSLFVVVAIGFVFALIFSWLYELTPEGLVRESEVSRDRSINFRTAKKLDYLTIGLLLGAIGLVVVDRYVLAPHEPETTGRVAEVAEPGSEADTAANSAVAPADASFTDHVAPAADMNSIAVLPFADLSPAGDQAYFSDGIAEELLNLLVRVNGLTVASRTSSFAFKGQNIGIPEIASQLKVAHILEGSVRKADNRVRITAQLIDTRNDRHLWSETFDRELVDIFAIQEEIATAILLALREEFGVKAETGEIVVKGATDNLDAYDLYLQGRKLFLARESLDKAIGLFERAIELDPGYTLAWEGLAAAHGVADEWLVDDNIDHEPLAIEAARKALELDPELSMPHAVLGNLDASRLPDGLPDIADALHQLDVAIEKDPKNATAWLWRGIRLSYVGAFDRAIADFDQCLAIDPAYLNCSQHRAAALLYRGDEQAALDAFIPTLYENFHSTDEAFVPVFVERGDSLTALLLATARLGEAYAPVGEWIKALEQPGQDHSAGLARLDGWAAEYGSSYARDFPDVLLAFGDYERAAQAWPLRYTMWGPGAKAFRQTPWFKQYLHDQGMEAYWREHGFPPMCRILDGANAREGDYVCE